MPSDFSEPEDQPSSLGPPSPNSELPPPGRKNGLVKGVAFGIGSAAIVAALLFAGRNKSKPEE